MRIAIRSFRWSDLPEILPYLTPEDQVEFDATGTDREEQLVTSVEKSSEAWTIVRDDLQALQLGVLGLVPVSDDMAGVWLTATTRLRECPAAFLRATRMWMTIQPWKVLRAWTWEGNAATLRWLGWAGFEKVGTGSVGGLNTVCLEWRAEGRA